VIRESKKDKSSVSSLETTVLNTNSSDSIAESSLLVATVGCTVIIAEALAGDELRMITLSNILGTRGGTVDGGLGGGYGCSC
jgi:hypothetical protein